MNLSQYFVRSELTLLEARYTQIKMDELKKLMGHHGFDYKGRNKEHAFTHRKTGRSFAVSDQPEGYGKGLMPKIAKDAAKASGDRDLNHRDNWDPMKMKRVPAGGKSYVHPPKPKMKRSTGRLPGRPEAKPLSPEQRKEKETEKASLSSHGEKFKKEASTSSGRSHVEKLRYAGNLMRKARKVGGELRVRA